MCILTAISWYRHIDWMLGRTALDRVGIAASTACAIHCLGGIVLAGASGIGLVLADERLELCFAITAVVIAVAALAGGFRRHRRFSPLVVGLVGVAAIVLARIAVPEAAEPAFSIAGAVLVVAGHVLNLRATRRYPLKAGTTRSASR
jgi:hypothetical protein